MWILKNVKSLEFNQFCISYKICHSTLYIVSASKGLLNWISTISSFSAISWAFYLSYASHTPLSKWLISVHRVMETPWDKFKNIPEEGTSELVSDSEQTGFLIQNTQPLVTGSSISPFSLFHRFSSRYTNCYDTLISPASMTLLTWSSSGMFPPPFNLPIHLGKISSIF